MYQSNEKRWRIVDYPCEGCPPPPNFGTQAPVIHPIPMCFDELLDHQKIAVSSIKKTIESYIGPCRMNLFGSQV